jgi:hypothetical protein
MHKECRKELANEIWQRHLDGSDFKVQWTNHHGLERCDCEELVEWLKNSEANK